MKVAFVIFPDSLYGGIARYMAMLANGLRRIKYPFKFIIVDKSKTNKTLIMYKQFGLLDSELIVAKDEMSAIKLMNKLNVIVYPSIKNAGDTPFFKKNPNAYPWWYDVVTAMDKPAVAFVHAEYDYTKYGPYADIYESYCQAFIAGKYSIALKYGEDRGKVDCYSLPLPIDCRKQYDLSVKRGHLISMTARIDSVKRLHHMVAAAKSLSSWQLDFHSGVTARDYFYMQNLLKIADSDVNIDFIDYDHAFSDDELDNIYKHTALTFNATYFPNGHDGIEYATLEACLRGVVPLISPEIVWPIVGCPPLDAYYKFEIYGKYRNSTENNLVDVVNAIHVGSRDFKERQRAIMNHVKENHDSAVIADQLIQILESVK